MIQPSRKYQIPPDLVVKFHAIDIVEVIFALMGRRSASQGCVATGNQGASCSRHPRPLGLPLNPLECGNYGSSNWYARDKIRLFPHWRNECLGHVSTGRYDGDTPTLALDGAYRIATTQ